MTDTFADYDAAALPAAVITYLDARDDHRVPDALAAFTTDATVVDDGRTYAGAEAVRDWIAGSSSQYTYTSTRTGQQAADPVRPVVRVRVDGTFPGGTVTLRHRFELRSGRIARLVIEV